MWEGREGRSWSSSEVWGGLHCLRKEASRQVKGHHPQGPDGRADGPDVDFDIFTFFFFLSPRAKCS